MPVFFSLPGGEKVCLLPREGRQSCQACTVHSRQPPTPRSFPNGAGLKEGHPHIESQPGNDSIVLVPEGKPVPWSCSFSYHHFADLLFYTLRFHPPELRFPA